MWFAYAPLAVKTDYPRLASFEVYGSAMPECIFCGFACYPGRSLLFCHKKKSSNNERKPGQSDRPDALLQGKA